MTSELWLVLLGAVFIIGAVAGNAVLLMIAIMLLLALGLARLWNKVVLARVTYTRKLSHNRAFVGDKVQYTVSLTNQKLLPLIWVDIQDRFPRALDMEGATLLPSHLVDTDYHHTVTSVAPYQRVTWRYEILCNRRGHYRIGPARVASGDPFGFMSREETPQHVEELIVYPRIVPLEALGLPSARPMGEVKGWQRIFEDPSRFAGVREYQHGDPIKRIDWKATARRQELQSKVYEPTVSLNLLVVLNVATTEHVWEGHNSQLLERAVTAAASVAHYGSSQRYALGLLTNGLGTLGGLWTKILPSRSPAQLSAVLEALARVGPYYIKPIDQLLLQEKRHLPPGLTIVLVTGIASEEMVAALREMARVGHRVALLHVGDGHVPGDAQGITVHRLGRALDRWFDAYGPKSA